MKTMAVILRDPYSMHWYRPRNDALGLRGATTGAGASVAESGRSVADPFPHRNRATYGRACDQRCRIEVLGVEAQRAHQKDAPCSNVAIEEVWDRRATLARSACGHAGGREPHSFLSEEDQCGSPGLCGADCHY